MNYAIYFWIAAVVIFAIVEAATVNLVSVWFIAGSIGALCCAALGAAVWVQTLVFLLLSLVLLLLLRPLSKKLLNVTKTNADRLIGREALVMEEIDNLRETGAIKIGGVEWTAKTETQQVIPVGTKIRILRIEGAKLIVEPAEVSAAVL